MRINLLKYNALIGKKYKNTILIITQYHKIKNNNNNVPAQSLRVFTSSNKFRVPHMKYQNECIM